MSQMSQMSQISKLHSPVPDDTAPSSEESDANVGALDPEKPVPDGGVKAWLMVLSAFSCNVCTFGYINSFGTYQTYYGKHMLSNKTASDISWIGSLQIFLLFFGGIASGPLADRHGVKAVVIPASFLMVFSVMMTSLCTEYYQFILSQGIAGGLASGMLFTPVVSTVGQYFSTKRAWAMGITVSGASVGGVIFPIALDRLLNDSNISFGWSVRVLGFIMLVLLSFTSFAISEHAARRKGRLFIAKAFTSVPWVCLNIAFFATLLGMYTAIFYIVDYSLAHGESTRMAAYEVPILNAMSFFGRTLPGYAGDKVGRLNMNLFMTAGTGVLIFCWVRTESNASITVFAALFGFFSGGVVSLYSPCIAETCPNRSDIGTYLGMGMAVASIAGLGGTPINGALIDRFGYSAASIFSGVMVLVGAGALLVARFHISRSFTTVV